jgi:hypothetical protein
MSDVTKQYTRALSTTLKQVSFIAGARSLTCDEEDQRKNLQVFKVPQAGIDTIQSRLAMKIYDEDANVLRGMYSVRLKL